MLHTDSNGYGNTFSCRNCFRINPDDSVQTVTNSDWKVKSVTETDLMSKPSLTLGM